MRDFPDLIEFIIKCVENCAEMNLLRWFFTNSKKILTAMNFVVSTLKRTIFPSLQFLILFKKFIWDKVSFNINLVGH